MIKDLHVSCLGAGNNSFDRKVNFSALKCFSQTYLYSKHPQEKQYDREQNRTQSIFFFQQTVEILLLNRL